MLLEKKNFEMKSLHFKFQKMQMHLISPSQVFIYHYICKVKSEIDVFPINFTSGYKQANYVDYLNEYGYGHNAVISINGCDKLYFFLLDSSLK